jgi:hypothetical protein
MWTLITMMVNQNILMLTLMMVYLTASSNTTGMEKNQLCLCEAIYAGCLSPEQLKLIDKEGVSQTVLGI